MSVITNRATVSAFAGFAQEVRNFSLNHGWGMDDHADTTGAICGQLTKAGERLGKQLRRMGGLVQ